MTKTPYLALYYNWAHIMNDFTDAECGKLIKAVIAYSEGKNETPKLSRVLTVAYKFIIDTIDRTDNRAANPESRPKKAKKASKKASLTARDTLKTSLTARDTLNEENREKFPEEYGFEEEKEDTLHTSPYSSASEKDNASTEPRNLQRESFISPTESKIGASSAVAFPTSALNEVSNATQTSASFPTQAVFTPPALDDVKALFARRGFKSDPEEFFNFYESKGWLVGQSPMRNWEASAANWEIKVVRERMNGKSTATQQVNKAPDIEKPRAGNFDIHEAFKKALERSYGGYYDDEDEEDEEI